MAAVTSVKFETGLTADCIDITIENNEVIFHRAAINESVVAKIICINSCMKMGTIKKGVFKVNKIGKRNIYKVNEYDYRESNRKEKQMFFEILEEKSIDIEKKIDINKYKIVFCLGRGVRNKKIKDEIVEIAKKIGAGIVGTRASVEDGLIKYEQQIGQSGKNIAPKLYIGFGVSGACQHMVGIKNAEIIVAINNDPNAPIFKYADYVIVEQIENIVEQIKKIYFNEKND